MDGKGILKGLGVTAKRFWTTYTEDIAWFFSGKKRYFNEEGVKARAGKDTKGIFTVQYPEERLIIPEEFRYVPFLVYDEADGKKEARCTSCVKSTAGPCSIPRRAGRSQASRSSGASRAIAQRKVSGCNCRARKAR